MSHGRNPGYRPGDHWVECQVCGFEYRASEMKERWDGIIVCREDYEMRHPQDFVRAQEDHIAAEGLVNPASEPEYIRTVDDPDETVPSGTFNEDTL